MWRICLRSPQRGAVDLHGSFLLSSVFVLKGLGGLGGVCLFFSVYASTGVCCNRSVFNQPDRAVRLINAARYPWLFPLSACQIKPRWSGQAWITGSCSAEREVGERCVYVWHTLASHTVVHISPLGAFSCIKEVFMLWKLLCADEVGAGGWVLGLRLLAVGCPRWGGEAVAVWEGLWNLLVILAFVTFGLEK